MPKPTSKRVDDELVGPRIVAYGIHELEQTSRNTLRSHGHRRICTDASTQVHSRYHWLCVERWPIGCRVHSRFVACAKIGTKRVDSFVGGVLFLIGCALIFSELVAEFLDGISETRDFSSKRESRRIGSG